MPSVYQADLTLVKDFLYELIARHATASGLAWLDNVLVQISKQQTNKTFYLAFGMASRQIGKNQLELTEQEVETANNLRPGFHPKGWSVLKTSRVLLMLSLPHDRPSEYHSLLNTLFSTADVHELEAMYASLPLLPYPEEFRARCAEGIRTNMRNVLDTIVLDNPYPADYLEEDAWNQMVLKAVFNGLPLIRIEGFDQRRNAHLARMLSDYAHERWAAGRDLTPELWRAVSPFLDESLIKDIEKLFANSNRLQQAAAALVCAESEWSTAKKLLNSHPHLQAMISNGELNWQTISSEQLTINN
ncbi:MAG: EboA domain-containing protein [Bacteroidota bacterium]